MFVTLTPKLFANLLSPAPSLRNRRMSRTASPVTFEGPGFKTTFTSRHDRPVGGGHDSAYGFADDLKCILSFAYVDVCMEAATEEIGAKPYKQAIKEAKERFKAQRRAAVAHAKQARERAKAAAEADAAAH